MALHAHTGRDCVYDELTAAYIYHKISKEDIRLQTAFYESIHMPRHYGMCVCNVIVRQHHNPVCCKIMEQWFELYMTYAKRDQLSFSCVLYQHHIPIADVAVLGDNVHMNPSFRVLRHR